MRRFFFAILFMAGIYPAFAAEAPVKQDPATALNPAKTTVLDCLTILNGLEEIDGLHPVVVNQGKPTEQVVNIPYEFANGALRKNMATDIRLLGVVRHDQQEASQKELMVISKGKGEIKEPEKPSAEEHAEYLRQTVAFNERMKQLTSAACPLDGLARIKSGDLKPDKNEIRAGALSAIDKILDWDK